MKKLIIASILLFTGCATKKVINLNKTDRDLVEAFADKSLEQKEKGGVKLFLTPHVLISYFTNLTVVMSFTGS